VGLLVYAPVGYALLVSGRSGLALVGGALLVALAMIPDIDMRVPGATHRGASHTLLCALCVGTGLGAVGWLLADAIGGSRARIAEGVVLDVTPVSPIELGAFGFLVGALVICSHLLADLLTPMGIAPFWPVSSKRYSLGLTTAANPIANVLLLGLGVLATAGVLLLVEPVG
jgi:inner membrane protein